MMIRVFLTLAVVSALSWYLPHNTTIVLGKLAPTGDAPVVQQPPRKPGFVSQVFTFFRNLVHKKSDEQSEQKEISASDASPVVASTATAELPDVDASVSPGVVAAASPVTSASDDQVPQEDSPVDAPPSADAPLRTPPLRLPVLKTLSRGPLEAAQQVADSQDATFPSPNVDVEVV